MKKSHLLVSGLTGLALYLIATGLSFAIFSYYGRSVSQSATTTPITKDASGKVVIDPGIPKTQECPLNGELFTQQEEDVWKKRRPLAVMIENHVEARPQSGLSSADIVYEAIVEGGITRFMGVFYCGAASNLTLAPVRSARSPYLPWVLEYDALYTHVGGAGNCNDGTVDERAKALCQIEQFKVKDMDQFGLPYKVKGDNGSKLVVCERNYDRLDHPVATEHTMVCYTDGLYKVAEVDRGWTNVDAKGVAWDKGFEPWKFKDDAKPEERGAASVTSFVGWKGSEKNFGVDWSYDPASNVYKRATGGEAHLDLETKEQLTAKVVIVIFAKETGPVDDHAHMLYANVGSGDGLVLQDGKTTKITWKKTTRSTRTKFYDASGKEISLNRGKVWIELLSIGTEVTSK